MIICWLLTLRQGKLDFCLIFLKDSLILCCFSGIPNSLHVKPEETSIDVENGDQVTFHVEVHDEAGNITANPKQIVRCEVQTWICSEVTGASVKTEKTVFIERP